MSFQTGAKSQAPQINVGNATVAALILALTFPYVSSLLLLKAPFILPALSAFAIASAALVALTAWGTASGRDRPNITLWDVSGLYAYVGFAAGMLSEPKDVMEVATLSGERIRGRSITADDPSFIAASDRTGHARLVFTRAHGSVPGCSHRSGTRR